MDRRLLGAWIAALVAVCACVMPAAAAADPGTVTITACKDDGMTVAGKVIVTGKDKRKVRGATLQMRFDAFSLFGLPQNGSWRVAGKKTRASGQQSFSGLGAGNWIGVLEWRYKKGRRTVMSDTVRSTPFRIGGKRGIANCTLAEGAKPVDSTPPKVFIRPTDSNWHHAPTAVQVIAQDDFSGVARVVYSVDGGPATAIANGGTFTIATEGAHTVAYSATDVAGNTTNGASVVKVDAAPPSKPVITGPPSVTANRQPTISWNPSVDTGSGVRGYFVAVRRADGSAVVLQPVDANTTSLVSPATLDDGQTYTVTITAVDNTADQAWSSDSDPYTFTVDTAANVTSVDPPANTILAGIGQTKTFTLHLDRPADPTTVAASVSLHRNSESGADVTPTVGCANNPCTAITVSAPMNEGRYVLAVNGLKSGDGEAQTFQSFSAAYAMPFLENASGFAVGGGFCVGNATSSTAATTISVASGAENGQLDFDWAYPTGSTPGWGVSMSGGTITSKPGVGGGGNGHAVVGFSVTGANNSVKFTFTSNCSAGSSSELDVSNIRATRLP